MDLILDFIFAYLVTLRHAGIDGELYRSLADTSRLDWDWAMVVMVFRTSLLGFGSLTTGNVILLQASRSGPSSTAQTLAEQMTRLPIEDLLSATTPSVNIALSSFPSVS